jgi:hypothetical protein
MGGRAKKETMEIRMNFHGVDKVPTGNERSHDDESDDVTTCHALGPSVPPLRVLSFRPQFHADKLHVDLGP